MILISTLEACLGVARRAFSNLGRGQEHKPHLGRYSKYKKNNKNIKKYVLTCT